MFIQQTIEEYIENPMGKGSTAIANKNLIKNDLNERYKKLLEKHSDFKHKRMKVGNDYYVHIKIPSESKRENTYDIVIRLSSMNDSAFDKDNTLKRYYMSVFSNCPSFVFTYAYVYNKYEMLIPELRYKFADIVFESNPSVKNPGEIINYEKSIYFACKYLKEHSMMLFKGSYSHISPEVLKNYFSKEIRNTTTIMREIDRENARLKEEKENEKKTKKEIIKKSPKVSGKQEKLTGTKQAKASKITPVAKIKPKSKIKPH